LGSQAGVADESLEAKKAACCLGNGAGGQGPKAVRAEMPGQARNASGYVGGSVANNATAPSRQLPEYESSREAKLRRDAFVRKLPGKVQGSVVELEGLDVEVSDLEAQFRRERRQLERRFEALYAPLLARRATIVTGATGVEARAGEATVPDFWLGSMKAETAVALNIMPKDESALKLLRDVTCSTLQEAKGVGFCLQFYFAPNKFFSNHILAKTYYLSGSDTEPILERAEGTDIRWKPGMNLTVVVQPRCSDPCPSFFRFFDTLRVSSDPALVNHVADWIESDYEVARAFKDKLVPHAVRWFTGEADDMEDFRSDGSCRDAEEAADELEAARFELALDAAVAAPQAK